MNIAICDDNLLDRELIVDLLECYFFNKSISYSIDQYENGDNPVSYTHLTLPTNREV